MNAFKKTTLRSVFESMTRGDLIDALAAAEAQPNPHGARMCELLRAERDSLAEQLRMLRTLHEQSEHSLGYYTDLFVAGPQPYFLLDRHANVRDANLAAATLFCTNRPYMLDVALDRLVTVADKEILFDHLARCIDERLRVTCELSVTVRGRGVITVQLVSTPCVAPDGSTVACRTSMHDVTRARRSLDHARFLAETHDAFGDDGDVATTAAAITRACVPKLGNVAFIDRLDAKGSLQRSALALATNDEALRSALLQHAADPAWHDYVERTLAANVAVFEPTSGVAFSTTIDVKAFMLLPMKRDQLLGLLWVGEGGYAVESFELAHELARRATRALEHTCV